MPRPFDETEKSRIRTALLGAGREALEKGGMRRTPVELLCRAAGISKGAFYLFFPSKEALVLALLQETEAEVRAGLLSAAEAGPREGRLRAVLEQLFSAFDRHPMLCFLGDPEEWAWLLRALPPGHLEEARLDDDHFSAALLGKLQEEGLVRPGVDPVAFGGIGMVAMGMARQRALVGEARWPAILGLLLESLEGELGRRG